MRLETPGAHPQRDAGVGLREQLVREPVALGAEGQHGARRDQAGPQHLTLGVQRDQRAVAVRITRERATGSAKCNPADPRSASACHGSCVPVVITPAAPAAAATRTTAPRLPRWRGASSRITGSGVVERDDAVRVRLPRTPRERHHLRARDHRGELLERHHRRGQHDVRRQPGRQRRELVGIGGPHAEQLRPEPHRVLDRVKALEHHEAGVAACALDVAEIHHCRTSSTIVRIACSLNQVSANSWLAVDSGTTPLVRAQELRFAWERWIANEDDDDPSILREAISDSWRRSSAAGVDPTGTRRAPIVSDELTTHERYEEHPLHAHQGLIHECLFAIADTAGYLIVVSDADGTLLTIEGSTPVRLRAAENMNFAEGTLWSEGGAGTNAIGTAIARRSRGPGLRPRALLAIRSSAGPAAPVRFTIRTPAR